MGFLDAEHLIGQLLASELGGGKRRRRKKRLSRSVRKAALSPQGLTLLGGIAFAAIEHLRSKETAQAAPPMGGGSAGAGARQVPPATGSPTQSVGRRASGPPPIPSPGAPPTEAPRIPPARPANLPPIPGSRVQADIGSPDSPTDGSPGPASAGGAPEEDAGRSLRSRVLVRAMVEAAKADGEVDSEERTRILDQLRAAGAGEEARSYVTEQLARPLDLEGLLAWIGTDDPTLSAEVYVASRIVIADETPAETAYLALLAARLGLTEGLVGELRSQVDQALESAGDA